MQRSAIMSPSASTEKDSKKGKADGTTPESNQDNNNNNNNVEPNLGNNATEPAAITPKK